jgi:hypothetical protein
MNDERIYDHGPQAPANADAAALAQHETERAAWVKKHGDAPVLISLFSAGEAVERDPARYRHQSR